MSDRLAISASISVLMMSIFVLFGAESVREPIGPGLMDVPAAASAPSVLGAPGQVLSSLIR